MSIIAAELIAYGPASRAVDDVATEGGAIDATIRPEFIQWTSNSTLIAVSDGADTRSLAVSGRLTTGVLAGETVVLNGATEVTGINVYERILSVIAASTSATRTVTVRQGLAVRGTIPVNEKGFYALFINSFSTASPQTRYEKIFWKNTNASLTLTSSIVTLTADPQSRIRIGLSTAVDDTGSVANRTTAPGGVSFVDDNVDQSVPGGGNLAAGSAIGVWVEEALLSNDPPFKSTFTTRLQGSTT